MPLPEPTPPVLITTWSHNRAHIDSGNRTAPNSRYDYPEPIALCLALGLSDDQIEERGITYESLTGLPLCKLCTAKYAKLSTT